MGKAKKGAHYQNVISCDATKEALTEEVEFATELLSTYPQWAIVDAEQY